MLAAVFEKYSVRRKRDQNFSYLSLSTLLEVLINMQSHLMEMPNSDECQEYILEEMERGNGECLEESFPNFSCSNMYNHVILYLSI